MYKQVQEIAKIATSFVYTWLCSLNACFQYSGGKNDIPALQAVLPKLPGFLGSLVR